MILECRRDTKLWPVSGASQYLYPEGQSQQTKRGHIWLLVFLFLASSFLMYFCHKMLELKAW
jgi:hypothetical protein